MNQCKQLYDNFSMLDKILSNDKSKKNMAIIKKVKKILFKLKGHIKGGKEKLFNVMVDDYHAEAEIQRKYNSRDYPIGLAIGYPVPIDVYYMITRDF